ncbi:type I-E CRISPR-associated protein Cas5/CasD [Streptomyces sp. NPDC093084]|uniref:type I-E CRISPR-associated protein Cas5/CasD n=1 Tax=Streptomyces sp. NPDC093084 TaxID=3155197 RepID=UPI00343D579E
MNPPAQPGLLLQLTGPLQSWGERSHFNDRDTAGFPTRSGVIGLVASALGRDRGAALDDLTELSVTTRVDRPGVLLNDLHTVGGGLPPRATVTTAEGKKRSGDTGTVLTHRTYLADAAFTLALTGPPDLLHHTAQALTTPHWPPYLGRRSCPPEGPLLLGHFDDALHHLVHLPIAAPRPHDSADIAFLGDRPLDLLPAPDTSHDPETGTQPVSQVNDQPLSFHPRHRSYRTRALYRRILRLPADQHSGYGTDHLNRLATYLDEHLNHPERTPR